MAAEPADIWRLVARGTIFQQRVMLTHHYVCTQVTGAPTFAQVADAILLKVKAGGGGGDVLESKYLACLPSNYTLDFWEVQLIRPIRLAARRSVVNVSGTHAQPTETTNLAVAVTLRSDFAGRWAQGTKHIGPIPDGATVKEDGLITNAYKTTVELFGAAMLQVLVTTVATLQPCLVHAPELHGGSTAVTSQAIGPEQRTMRRRTVNVGV